MTIKDVIFTDSSPDDSKNEHKEISGSHKNRV